MDRIWYISITYLIFRTFLGVGPQAYIAPPEVASKFIGWEKWPTRFKKFRFGFKADKGSNPIECDFGQFDRIGFNLIRSKISIELTQLKISYFRYRGGQITSILLVQYRTEPKFSIWLSAKLSHYPSPICI